MVVLMMTLTLLLGADLVFLTLLPFPVCPIDALRISLEF